tara:strand:+ start:1889 stop:2065 length:177 start_codon:yes stop_codon:yes gene_type:complete
VSYLKFSEHEDYNKFERKVERHETSKKYTEEEMEEWKEWAENWIEKQQKEGDEKLKDG